MTTVRALVIPAGGSPEVKDLTPDLDTLKGLVGGWIEYVHAGTDWHAYCDEEGKLKGSPPNYSATRLAHHLGWPHGDVLVGDVVFLGKSTTEPGEEGDVPQHVIDTWQNFLRFTR